MQCKWGFNNSDVESFPIVKDQLKAHKKNAGSNGRNTLSCAATLVGAEWVNIKVSSQNILLQASVHCQTLC